MNFQQKMVPWMFPMMTVQKTRKARQTFTTAEDELLTQLVGKLGEYDWNAVAQQMPGRTPRQCRDRWKGYLAPNLSSEEWSRQEDQMLIEHFNKHGPRWSMISSFIKGRSEVAVKNRWKLLFRRSKGAIIGRSPPTVDEETKPDAEIPSKTEPKITIPVGSLNLLVPDFIQHLPSSKMDLDRLFSSLQCPKGIQRAGNGEPSFCQ